jgi:hypothetical protein
VFKKLFDFHWGKKDFRVFGNITYYEAVKGVLEFRINCRGPEKFPITFIFYEELSLKKLKGTASAICNTPPHRVFFDQGNLKKDYEVGLNMSVATFLKLDKQSNKKRKRSEEDNTGHSWRRIHDLYVDWHEITIWEKIFNVQMKIET